MTEPTLQDLRGKLDELLVAAVLPSFRSRALGDAVMIAARCDLFGQEYDLRRYSYVLSLAMEDAERNGIVQKRDGYAALLVATTSDVADTGDEEAATGLNTAIERMPVELVRAGLAAYALRRKARDGE